MPGICSTVRSDCCDYSKYGLTNGVYSITFAQIRSPIYPRLDSRHFNQDLIARLASKRNNVDRDEMITVRLDVRAHVDPEEFDSENLEDRTCN